jgi:hypothetical protein
MAGTASGIALTSIVMLGAVGVAVGATVLALLGTAGLASLGGTSATRLAYLRTVVPGLVKGMAATE